jgi:hypothetical protein
MTVGCSRNYITALLQKCMAFAYATQVLPMTHRTFFRMALLRFIKNWTLFAARDLLRDGYGGFL